MDFKFLLPILVTIFLAFIGYIAKYVNDVHIAKRKDKLERINRQLKDFYGPLLSLTNSSNSAWQKFRLAYRSDVSAYFNDKNPPSELEKETWRLWILTVFFPIIERKYDIIISNTDLIEEDFFPECLKDFCAHVNTYRPVIERWKKNDFTEHVSLINYPVEINEYLIDSFNKLKKKQKRLIG